MKIRFIGLFIAVFLQTNSWAQTWSPWKSEFLEPCECSSSLEEAVPFVLANRLPEKFETPFLPNLVKLIDGFAADPGMPQDRKYIYWTVYELGAFDIVNALARARQAGVQVFLVTDGKSILTKPAKKEKADDEEEENLNPKESVSILQDRHLLTREAFKVLQKAGVKIAFSDPEFEPLSTSYPPIMHEKVRIFAVRPANKIVPVLGYVSTHNDTYSETVGDPLPSLDLERLKQGKLLRSEIEKGSRGNIQTALVIRHEGILQSLLKNARDQFEVYRQGKGRIHDVENQKPTEFELQDGTKIKLSYTYAKTRSAYNPNSQIKEFIKERLETASNEKFNGHIQQFVYSFGGASETLKDFVEANTNSKFNVWIDGSFAFEPYSQGRKMAGLFTVLTYRKKAPIDFPWKKELRTRVRSLAYVHPNDKLHTKNAHFKYEAAGGERHRIFTGSLNLSSNGVSNKEVFFEIDTQSDKISKVLDLQAQYIEAEGFLRPLSERALFKRVRKTANNVSGEEIKESDPKVIRAFDAFLGKLGKSASDQFLKSMDMMSVFEVSKMNLAEPEWLKAMGEFYDRVGAEKAVNPIFQSVRENLNKTSKFFPTVPTVDILLHITENQENIEPEVRQAILDLF